MTVLMYQKRFVAPILAGIKKQTIRPNRKRPIKVGDALSHRHWEDKAYRSPQVEFLANKCLASLAINIHDCGLIQIFDSKLETQLDEIDHIQDLDRFARGDGFTCWLDMRSYWLHNGGLPFTGVLIQWE